MGNSRVVVRHKNGHAYAELVESYYDPVKKSSRSKFLKYLGVVTGYNQDGSPIISNCGMKMTRFYEVISSYDNDPIALAFFNYIFNNKVKSLVKKSRCIIPATYDYYYFSKSNTISLYYELFVIGDDVRIRIGNIKLQNPNPKYNTNITKQITDQIEAIYSQESQSEDQIDRLCMILESITQVVESLHRKRIDLLSCIGSYEKALETLIHYCLSELPITNNLNLILSVLFNNGMIIENGNVKYCALPLS